MIRYLGLIAVVFGLTTEFADAMDVVTRCNSLSGKEYYISPKHGWIDNSQTDDSRTTVIRDSNGKYDIIMSSKSSSHKEAVDKVITDKDGHNLTFIAIFRPEVIRIYQFTLDAHGNGDLIYGEYVRDVYMGPLGTHTHGNIFTAKCSK